MVLVEVQGKVRSCAPYIHLRSNGRDPLSTYAKPNLMSS